MINDMNEKIAPYRSMPNPLSGNIEPTGLEELSDTIRNIVKTNDYPDLLEPLTSVEKACKEFIVGNIIYSVPAVEWIAQHEARNKALITAVQQLQERASRNQPEA